MKHTIYIAILILFLAISTFAHPLGNFSVNQFSQLDVSKNQIKLLQVLDLAEIPTFQLKDEIDQDKNGLFSNEEINAYTEKITPEIAAKLSLSVNNQIIPLQVVSKVGESVEGAGNLQTLRIEWNLKSDISNAENNRVSFANNNFTERLGWNEIVINRTDSVNIFDSTAFGNSLTNQLKTYPENQLNSPLNERKAEFSFTTNALNSNEKPLQNRDGENSSIVQKDRLAELIALPEITPMIALFGLFLAFSLGAMHALSPGHGKTVVGAYLVGSRGTFKHATFLGLTVTITHTIGVFALGLITLFASNYILPEKIMPFLNFVSGLLVFFIGITLFKERLFTTFGWNKSNHHGHSHHHHSHEHHLHGEHSHSHDSHHHHHEFTHTHDGHTHSHLPPEEITWKNLLGLGISGGLLPCPSALVLMLSAISLGRVGYGIILTLVFSLGLAATLTSVGLIFLYVGKVFGNSKFGEYRIIKTLPVFSAFLIACFGAVICYNSIS
jgi:ABC-type nickel/cobalt efflux system permease component RcnA